MVKQLWYVPVHVYPGIMAVETELMTLFLDPGVETPSISAEADAEQVLVLGRISQQKTSLWFVFQ